MQHRKILKKTETEDQGLRLICEGINQVNKVRTNFKYKGMRND